MGRKHLAIFPGALWTCAGQAGGHTRTLLSHSAVVNAWRSVFVLAGLDGHVCHRALLNNQICRMAQTRQ